MDITFFNKIKSVSVMNNKVKEEFTLIFFSQTNLHGKMFWNQYVLEIMFVLPLCGGHSDQIFFANPHTLFKARVLNLMAVNISMVN